MDWPLAIERNRQALLAIVASIVALLGGRDGEGPIARGLRSTALALLRPAEAAARRLIVIAAEGLYRSGLVVALPPPRPLLRPIPARADGGGRKPCFALFERPKRHRLAMRAAPRGIPRIRTFWSAPPPAPPPFILSLSKDLRPAPPALVDGTLLRLRLAALEFALADIPRQARRIARRRLRRGPAPLRFGAPPGWRSRPGREVDLVLRECHALARDVQRRDTS